MIQLNLLPDLKKEYIKTQKNESFVISVSIITTIVAVGLSVLMFLYVNVAQNIQIALATDEIKNKTQQLNDTPDLSKYLTIQNQLAALPGLHEQKGVQSRLLNFLDVLNPSKPNNVQLATLQLSVLDKTLLFRGTTNNFEALNVFVDTLKNASVTYTVGDSTDTVTGNMFGSVLIQSSGLSKSRNKSLVAFAIVAVYNDAVVASSSKNIKVTVPKITTTHSVTQSPKPEIFSTEGIQ